ncbi:class I SAM-dependent DNA methyltransferase [Actinoplanes sp. NPDC049265]|uniref:class I SAM-dependent DNA methyltransferase n=1 Tax=Actinoplanes sp. NPDC049265 TaxID=3363902 RepID=UPI00371D2FC2
MDLDNMRDSYSRIAADYAAAPPGEGRLTVERALIGIFADRILTGADRTVADVGCGPGEHTAVLRERGLDAYGLDLAPGMVALARRNHPGVPFEVGSMSDLGRADGSLGGVLSAYSIIHVPRAERAGVLAEFFRVLAPGGLVMLVFQVGDEQGRREDFNGHAVGIDWYRLQPDEVVGLLRAAGFEMWVRAVHESQGPDPAPQAYLIAVKP